MSDYFLRIPEKYLASIEDANCSNALVGLIVRDLYARQRARQEQAPNVETTTGKWVILKIDACARIE